MLHFDGDGDDTKGDDNKASGDPGDINRLPDDFGERVGKGSDDDAGTPL